MTSIALSPIQELAPLIERRDLSPSELMSEVLEAIERVDPLLQTYISVFSDEAMEAAARAEKEIADGDYLGPLHGIPVAIKDSIAVAGWPTTNGSRLWADNVTDFDATVVQELRDGGAIIIGKSNMHEWGMGGTCTGMHFGTVRNPWDPSRVPGGSSGGSAAAVSAGLAVASIGADGWGSIRTPASYCGVVGLMPTQGLVSRYGELPPTSSWHHTIGPITRTVTDAAVVLDAVAGHDPRDPTSVDRYRPGSAIEGMAGDIAGLRVGIPTSYFFDDAVPAVRAAVAAAAGELEAMGAGLEEVDLDIFYNVPLALAAAQHESQQVLLRLALDEPGGFATPEIRYRILAGEFVGASDRMRGMQVRNRMRTRLFESVFSRVDVVLSPCNSTVAFPIGATTVPVGTEGGEVDLGSLYGQSRLTTRLTLPWNLMGVPALSLPSGDFSDGLPIAIQLAARPFQESLLLRIGQAYETSRGGYRVPPAARPPASEGADL